MPIVGRVAETLRINATVDRIHSGAGGALIVTGEPGIGKTALLEQAAARTAGSSARILTAAGSEAEAHLPYYGLEALLRPLRGTEAALPASQRDALRASLGTDGTSPADPYLAGLAVLNLLAEAAEDRPVLLIVEDLHWLDPSSAEALAFVGRRLESEAIVLLAAKRNGHPSPLDPARLPELMVGPLTADASGILLDTEAPRLPPAVRRRVLDLAAGNPLALRELAVSAGAPDAGTTALSPSLPLTSRLEKAFTDRLAGFGTHTRLLLLIGALNDGSTTSEIFDSAGMITGESGHVQALAPAVEAGLIHLEPARIEFRHPLMRSAIVQAADSEQRRSVHAALARALEQQGDRGLWHLALSEPGTDDGLAAAMEDAATRAERRGGVAAAIAALEHAARLSSRETDRAERYLGAAALAVESGRREEMVRLLDEATRCALSAQQQARVQWTAGRFEDGVHEGTSATALATLAETVAADGDTRLALQILWTAARRTFWVEGGYAARHKVMTTAENLPVAAHDPQLIAILAYCSPVSRGHAITTRLRHWATHRTADASTDRLLGTSAVLVGAFDLASSFSGAALAGLRAQGRLALVARALAAQAWSAALLADLTVAVPAAEEAARLCQETTQPLMYAISRATQALIAALRGEFDQAWDLSAQAEGLADPLGAHPALATARMARGLAAAGEGRFAEALAHLRRLHDPSDPSFHMTLRCYGLIDLVDAASHAGRTDEIDAIMLDMRALGARTPSTALHVGLRYAGAVLASDDVRAESLFREALRADLTRWPFARARTQLAYGERLRRARRPADARPHLRAARDAFDALGVEPFSGRAREELRAAGEASPERIPRAHELLTPQELQIAQMAAEGLTNREIGERLYLSHRTVGTHLHRIFPKLGVTSRAAVRDALTRGG